MTHAVGGPRSDVNSCIAFGSIANRSKRDDPVWVADRFDRIAGVYPLFERLFLVPKKARIRAVDLLDVGSGDRILVVGCGHGPALKVLSEETGPTGKVVGVDLSHKMLQRAEREIAKHAFPNVELIHSDFFDLRPETPFDAILFEFSLTSFGRPLAGLRAAWSLLRTGGSLVVLDGQLPAGTQRLTRPLMPTIRWVLEQTVLGDPDMRPLEYMATLGAVQVEWFRHRSYFVSRVRKVSRTMNRS